MRLDPADLRRIARFVRIRFREDDLSQVAGSLTFTTLFGLVPLVTIALTVFSVLPVSRKVVGSLNDFIVSNFVPGSATKLITAYTHQFAEKASGLTAVGIVMLAVSAIMMMMTIDRAFNRIWRVQQARPLVRRVLVYWAMLTIGPLLIGASVYFTYWLVATSFDLLTGRDTGSLLLRAVSTVLTMAGLVFLYMTVPSRRVMLRDALAGAVTAGVAFEAMKWGFAYFIARVGDYRLVYGAFAGFPVFLVWLYLSWVIVLVGAEMTAALPQLRTGAWSRYRVPGSRYVEALAMLRDLVAAHARGGTLSLDRLARAGRLTWEDAEDILGAMASRGWLARGEGGRWLLAKDADRIRVADVFDMFVFRSADLAREAVQLGLESTRWDARSAVTDAITLAQWCRGEGEANDAGADEDCGEDTRGRGRVSSANP